MIRRLIILLLAAVLQGCTGDTSSPPRVREWNEEPGAPATPLENVETVLPQAGNVALIEANCVPCHSLTYIQSQPELSRKAWEKIVDKMINTYGAPERDSQTRQEIIDYLVAIKGRK